MSTLLVTDLDGTLWDDTEICHPRTLEAVAELERRGVPLLVATGRRRWGAELGFERNRLKLPAVLVNGAAGYDFRSGVQLFEDKFDLAFITEVVVRLEEVGLSPALFTSPDQVVVGPNPTVGPKYVGSIERGLVQSDNLVRFVASEEAAILGFAFLAMTRRQLDQARATLAELNYDSYSFHNDLFFPGWMLMGQAPGVNKWTGIRRYVDDVLGEVDRIVVVGDSTNDVPMFTEADLSVWVDDGSGLSSLADQADLKIDGPSGGGWAAMVDLVSEAA